MSVLNTPFKLAETSLIPHFNRRNLILSFDSLGLPKQSDELWKYVPLETFYENEVSTSDLKIRSASIPGGSVIIDIASDSVSFNRSSVPDGLEISELYADKDSDISNSDWHFSEKEPNAFALLNNINWTKGVVINVTQSTNVPIVIRVNSNDGDTVLPRILINAEANTTSEVIYISESTSNALVNSLFTIHLAENATCSLTPVQVSSQQHFSFFHTRVLCKEGAVFNAHGFSQGAAIGYVDYYVDLSASNAYAQLNGIKVANGSSKNYTFTKMDHHVAQTNSDQTFKALLFGESKTEYNGLVHVHKKAHDVESTQTNQNLLLSDKAIAYARPQLKIDANDVQCAHGSSTGQINEDELFYLQSRGFNRLQATEILLNGFVDDVLDKIPYQWVRDHIHSVVYSIFENEAKGVSRV